MTPIEIGKLEKNELSFAYDNPTSKNYVKTVSTSDVISMLSCSSYSFSSLTGIKHAIIGENVSLTLSRVTGGESLDLLEIRNPNQSINIGSAFQNMKSTASIVFWLPLSAFSSLSLAGCPKTLYFKNAEINEIVISASNLYLSNDVVIIDKYGKQGTVAGGEEQQLFITARALDDSLYTISSGDMTNKTYDITLLKNQTGNKSLLSVEFHLGGFTLLGLTSLILNIETLVFDLAHNFTNLMQFLSDTNYKVNTLYFKSNTINQISALASNLKFGLTWNGMPFTLTVYCSDGVIVFGYNESGSSGGGGGQGPYDQLCSYTKTNNIITPFSNSSDMYLYCSMNANFINEVVFGNNIGGYDDGNVLTTFFQTGSSALQHVIYNQIGTAATRLDSGKDFRNCTNLRELDFTYHTVTQVLQAIQSGYIKLGSDDYGNPKNVVINCKDGVIIITAGGGGGSSGSY